MIEEAFVRGDPRAPMGYSESIFCTCAAFQAWTFAVWALPPNKNEPRSVVLLKRQSPEASAA